MNPEAKILIPAAPAEDILFVGRSVLQMGDPLMPVPLNKVIERIRCPRVEIQDLIRQLRALRSIDKKRYDGQKKLLPYLVCGHFKPAVRRREHFLKISNFMLDLDGVSAHVDMMVLRQKLQGDAEVLALFASPGGDGLKVLFRLKEPCFDAGHYAAFYKLFARQFAQRHQLEDIIDFVTSDVSRACFISWDEEAWLNPVAEAIDLEAYASISQPDELMAAVSALEEDTSPQEKQARPEGPAQDVLQAIRQKLNPGGARKAPVQRQYEQPPQLAEKLPLIRQGLEAVGISLAEISPISFGKRLRVTAGNYWAEINIYYGKRGFTCVATTKTNSHAPLGKLAKSALEEIFATLQ